MQKIRMLLALLLAAALLAGCGTAGQPAPAQTVSPAEAEALVVTDTAGLLTALGSGRSIVIDAPELHLEDAPDYGIGYSDGAYTWEQTSSGEYALVIRGLDTLHIRGRDGGTLLDTGCALSAVLRFEDCRNLTLEALTLGHRDEVVGCAGDVLDFQGCENVTLRRCELFGCGVIAVYAYLCVRLFLEDCILRDCTLSALNAVCCTNVQARNCQILRCGADSYFAALCASGCNGFALFNCTIRDGSNSTLLDASGSSSVFLLGCEAAGNRFSEALLRLYDGGVTIDDSALAENNFSACYTEDSSRAVKEDGTVLEGVSDFLHMERRPFEGSYIGPAPYVTPGDVYGSYWATPGDIAEDFPASPDGMAPLPLPADEAWDGQRTEVHVTTVDELLAAIAPHTTVFLDGEEFDLSTASDYGGSGGAYYIWNETFDGPELVLVNLEDFVLQGGGMGVTLLSAQPRYADVLGFDNCFSVKVADMTVGHNEEPGFCSGGVLQFGACGDITVERCGLFGCGTVGVTAADSYALNVTDCNIYDCSYYGAELLNVRGAYFTGCSITDCGGEYGFNGLNLAKSSEVYYEGELVTTGQYTVD